MGLGAPAKPFRPSPRDVQLGAVSNRTICRARHVVRLRTRRSLSESGRPASLKRVPTPLLPGSPGLATMLTVAGYPLPGSAFEPGSRGDAGTCCLVSARTTIRSLTTWAFINGGIRQSFILCSHVNTWAALTRQTGEFTTYALALLLPIATQLLGTPQEVSSCYPQVWIRKQLGKLNSKVQNPLRGHQSAPMKLRANVHR